MLLNGGEAFLRPSLEMKFVHSTALSILLFAATGPAASAATVFTSLSSPPDSSVLVKGAGGFIPPAIEYGFEFTVSGGDHQLTTITLAVTTHFGSLPLLVELYGSPSGPDAAIFLTNMTGPSQPAHQNAVYTPVLPTTLTDGSTYFLRLWVNGSASSYGIPQSTTFGTGTFTMGDHYQRNAGSSWGPGSHGNEPLVEINAAPVPEPASMALGCTGFLLILRRRRW
jgi:hypothetical protein